jgi:hypothetical protein
MPVPLKDYLERIRVATYEAPVAHSATEWNDRLAEILEDFADAVREDLAIPDEIPGRRARSVVMCPHGFIDRSQCVYCHWSP